MHREPGIEDDPIYLTTEECSDISDTRCYEKCGYNAIPVLGPILDLVPRLVEEYNEESHYTTSKRETIVIRDEKLFQKCEDITRRKEVYKKEPLRSPIREDIKKPTKKENREGEVNNRVKNMPRESSPE